MRQIDEIHDPENQRQAGCEQKQQHTKLKPVQDLDENQSPVHSRPTPIFVSGKQRRETPAQNFN